MTNYHEAGTLKIKGVSYNVSVGDDGAWYAWPGGTKISAMTRSELGNAISRQTRKAVTKVAVPFVQLNNERGTARRGTATGLHSRSGNTLVRWDDNGQAEQFPYYGQANVTGPLTDEQVEEWAAKRRQHQMLASELREFERAHKIELAKEVRAALDKAVAGEDTP